MPTNILMPALSPTMEKGNLARWLKKEGDAIKAGDIIAEIETDKATMEVEAVDEGTLAKIVVPDGTADVAVNDVIGVIAGEGEDAGSVTTAPAASKAPAPAAGDLAVPVGLQYERAPKMEPVAGQAAKPAAVNGHDKAEGGRVFSSPLARRIAKESGIDLGAIQGSGPHGRVVERDVKAAMAGGGAAKAAPKAADASQVQAPAATPAPAPKPVAASDETVKKMFAAGSFTEVPHDGMRKTIARRLVEAKQTIPHFYVTVDCELDALLALREQINAAAPKDKDGKPGYKVSVNDMVIKAMALALQRVPEANVTWTEATMLKHKHADIGVAVSIPGGLITPIIRAAETKTLSVISNEMKDYAARARAKKLKPEEYQGGTCAVSNLGMFGVKNFQAIVNPPHATILAVGAGEKRVVVKKDAPAIATIMSVTLSTDHRAVDGALGAELIAAFKTLIEHPMSLLV
ncbi:pyruvate dehydrogenase complex dihydrolipoamide acetyltransferase [Lichenifustis flavocetrariae]|uniref:Acetyltransferase component of pyruvate dehydrogenase complex n=1 Tax=Lichenifustis flavocetrariae TaxID=2949735 RepID=A0AA42CIC3_9HYPH|nr:pyruvate dehydrogenase complex dihydrolipoamide acetyltransferase [Lichenifustis flavocetrariae]MCW6506706.1 pyruvate dehydrogenase complex dihydrolipoamide acetyltransferase [Lichenifustis flavocetrariae]